MALSNDGMILASAQCSIPIGKEKFQAKIIIWDTNTLREKLFFHQSVQAIQSMAFSRDDRFFITIGNYRKPMLTLWSTNNYSHLLNWQNESSLSYINCLAWNPLRTNEFCLGSTHGIIHFCTINEQIDDTDLRLQVIKREIPILLNEHTITSCIYLTTNSNLILCATNSGVITCWNSRLCLCVLHWKADINEICYMSSINHKLLTGSSIGCLKLCNIENLESNLGQLNSNDS